jgi:hypothetical protein
MSSSDERWLKRLGQAAEPVSAPRDADEREADLLRGAVLRASNASSTSDEEYRANRGPRDEVLRDQLFLAARREGLIGRRMIPTWGWTSGIGVAAALLLGIALSLHRSDGQTYSVEPTLRTDPANVQTVLNAQPRARAESLAETLQAAGADVKIYQQGDVYTLDIVVVPESFDAITRALRSQGLAATQRSVRIRIRRSPEETH